MQSDEFYDGEAQIAMHRAKGERIFDQFEDILDQGSDP
ncbi:hypothetical protein ASZ90_009919 [hydrocarbon metagenome]|uniref:Uncharacterized protein n=1 Tax=hydrocarbon metagenome TaxID=938273 RepID=A0A0W8FI65_9ZZZZ